MTSLLPTRPKVDVILQASKWQKIPVLLELDEMRSLLDFLGEFWIVQVSGLIPIGHEKIDREEFLEVYSYYLLALKKGEDLFDPRVRSYFSSAWTTFPEALYAVKINDTHGVVKVCQPVVQLQSHRCDYSYADETFRSMVIGISSISWGLQFSFPHLYQNENLQVLTVREGPEFPNAILFKRIQQWVRSHTVATPFELEGKKMNVPIRLGKNCFPWINQHPQLLERGIRVSNLR